MTKIRIMSDLHLEFGPLDLEPAGEDVLCLGGDIGIFTEGIEWADAQARKLSVPVVMIAGNHEFYQNSVTHGHSVDSTLAALREYAATTEGRVHFLDGEVAVVAGARFIGATLWTDFELFGTPERAMRNARGGMNDYRCIHYRLGTILDPEDTRREHALARIAIEEALRDPFDGPTIVMTHHAPTKKSIAGRYARDEYSPAYASNLDWLVEKSRAALWQHGHVHHSFDYTVGETRVRSNPRGYYAYEENPKFDPNLVIEVKKSP